MKKTLLPSIRSILDKSSPLSAADGEETPPERKLLWALLPNILILAGIVAWLWMRRRMQLQEQPTYVPLAPRPPQASKAEVRSAAGAPVAPARRSHSPEVAADDLTRIEGIGPKIARLLQEAGVRTYAQLAAIPRRGAAAHLAQSRHPPGGPGDLARTGRVGFDRKMGSLERIAGDN